MIEDNDRHYYRRRAEMERACAEAATSDQMRRLHCELAELYEDRAAEIEVFA